MDRRSLLSALGVAAGTLSLASIAPGAEVPAGAVKPPSSPRPPYLVTHTEHLFVLFEADADALRSLLPPDVRPAKGNVVGLNMYRTGPVVGLVPYTGSYLWANVEGFDSPDGTPGRWMMQGWYGPEAMTKAAQQSGFPVTLGETRYQRNGNALHAVLNSDGADLIEAAITLNATKPMAGSVYLKYPVLARKVAGAPASGSEVAVNRIPAFGEVFPATPGELHLRLRDGDPAKVIHPKRVLNALHFRGTAFVLGVVDLNPPEAAALRKG